MAELEANVLVHLHPNWVICFQTMHMQTALADLIGHFDLAEGSPAGQQIGKQYPNNLPRVLREEKRELIQQGVHPQQEE